MNSSTESALRKFSFETQFSDAKSTERKPQARHSDEALERARAEGFAAGRASLEAELESADRQNALALAQQLAFAIEALQHATPAMHEIAGEIALAVARRAAHAAWDVRREPLVSELIREAVESAAPRARIVIKVNPLTAPKTAQTIESLITSENWEQQIVVKPEPLMRDSMVAIEWSEGAIVFDCDDILARLESSVRDALRNENDEGDAL